MGRIHQVQTTFTKERDTSITKTRARPVYCLSHIHTVLYLPPGFLITRAVYLRSSPVSVPSGRHEGECLERDERRRLRRPQLLSCRIRSAHTSLPSHPPTPPTVEPSDRPHRTTISRHRRQRAAQRRTWPRGEEARQGLGKVSGCVSLLRTLGCIARKFISRR